MFKKYINEMDAHPVDFIPKKLKKNVFFHRHLMFLMLFFNDDKLKCNLLFFL